MVDKVEEKSQISISGEINRQNDLLIEAYNRFDNLIKLLTPILASEGPRNEEKADSPLPDKLYYQLKDNNDFLQTIITKINETIDRTGTI